MSELKGVDPSCFRLIFGSYDPDALPLTRDQYSRFFIDNVKNLTPVGKVTVTSTPMGDSKFQHLWNKGDGKSGFIPAKTTWEGKNGEK